MPDSTKLIAACGLNCKACGAFIASATDNQALRIKTAAEWTTAHGFAFTPDMINCHGCFATDGVQIGHCSACAMRACVVGKGLSNCAGCQDLGNCDKTREFYTQCPEALATLRELQSRSA